MDKSKIYQHHECGRMVYIPAAGKVNAVADNQSSRKLVSPLLCFLIATAVSASAGTFTNVIIGDGADPWPMYLSGNYYLSVTTGWDIEVRTATRLAGTNGISAAS